MNATEEIFMINAIPSSSQPSTSTQKLGELVLSGGPQVNLENVKDFSHVCRTCATITEFVIPIFAGEGLQNNLADKIHKHLPIQVCVEDRLPQVVCYQCSSTLLAWHELVQCCLHADTALRARLASDTLQEPKTSNVISNSIENEAQPKDVTSEEAVREDSKCKVDEIIEKPEYTITENGKRYAKCGVCQKSVSVSSWARHVRTHRGERRHSCHTCGLAFGDSANLARHERALHARLRPHACAACGKTFSRKSHLQEHARSHSGNRAYVCATCGAASKSAAALRSHARSHAAPRHACVTCGARFKRRAELAAHLSVHSGERPHACVCGRTFRLRAQLTAHARTHAPHPPPAPPHA